MAAIGRAIKRFARTTFALLISAGVAAAQKDPKYLVLAPVINAVAKYLREKIGLKYLPL